MDLFSSLYPFSFCSLASGSNGNCYYVGNGDEGILIDAGITLRSIRKRLSEVGIPMKQIKAILISHAHIDHIKGLSALANTHALPVYASFQTCEGILRNWSASGIRRDLLHTIEDGEKVQLAGLLVETFAVSHDAAGALGYHIRNSHNSITIATDLGFICEKASRYLSLASMLVIESNYDDEMLTNGRYPLQLQKRIRGDKGHLSNVQAADYLTQHYHAGMKQIFLCHLSQHNNTPELALKTLHQHFIDKKVSRSPETVIRALPRGARTELIHVV